MAGENSLRASRIWKRFTIGSLPLGIGKSSEGRSDRRSGPDRTVSIHVAVPPRALSQGEEGSPSFERGLDLEPISRGTGMRGVGFWGVGF